MPHPVGTLIDNRYEIRRFIDSGNFGEVYEVLDHHQDQIVALKLLDPTRIGPWPWDEPSRLTRLRSDYVLPVWNADVAAGVPYIVTALARGGNVAAALARQPYTPVEAVRSIRDAARGTARAHDEGVVHRDIKLENLFLRDDDRVLLGDFGLAHPLDPSGRAPAAGTPATQAPEVLIGGPTSTASDIYSLGACLYRLLTGINPYQDLATDLPSFMAAVAAGPPTPVRDRAPHVPRRLATVLESAMARSAADRYRSAGAFDGALGRLPAPARQWRQLGVRHPSHAACWETVGHSLGLNVCLIPAGTRVDISVTRMPSGRHILRHCHRRVAGSAVAGRLRRIFESLGN